MKQAAAYLRVSTTGQEDEQTIESQLTEIKDRVAKDGLVLTPGAVYRDDGWTGTILERPALDRLRSDARDKQFDILYFYDRGRLSRRFVYQEVVIDELQQLGIDCISLHDINGKTPEEQLMGNVMGIFHEYERIKITERFRLGKFRKVRDNKKLLGYNGKYGYDYNPRLKGQTARDGFFSINEAEAENVKKIFDWFLETESVREVIRRLHSEGIPPRKQHRTIWTKSPVVRILRDTTYIGEHYYNKTEAVEAKNPKNPDQKYKRIKKTSRKARPKDEWLLVNVPPLIDKDIFQRAQTILEANKKFARRNNSKNDYLLSGLIACSCGKARTGDPGGNGNLYYRCTDRLSRFPLERKCFKSGVNAKVLDEVTWQQIMSFINEPKMLEKQAVRWMEKQQLNSEQEQVKKDAVRALNALESEEKRYVKAYGDGYMSEEVFKEQIDSIKSKRLNISSTLKADNPNDSLLKNMTASELIKGAKLTVKNLDFNDRKVIVRRLISRIEADQDVITVWGQIPISSQKVVCFEPEHSDRQDDKQRADYEEQVVLDAEYRHSRPTQCRQVHPF